MAGELVKDEDKVVVVDVTDVEEETVAVEEVVDGTLECAGMATLGTIVVTNTGPLDTNRALN